MSKEPKRRLRQFRITPELLGEFVKNGERSFRIENGAPESASFVKARYDGDRRCFVVVYEDASFKEVEHGNPIPMMNDVTITDLRNAI
jgi:hypothetical protein